MFGFFFHEVPFQQGIALLWVVLKNVLGDVSIEVEPFVINRIKIGRLVQPRFGRIFSNLSGMII